MSNTKIKQLITTIIFSSGAIFINYIINFLLTQYITNNIGSDAYGFISLAKNFASYAGIITIALNSYAARFISIEYFNGNKKMANQYFSSVFFADVCIGLFILIISIIGIINIQYLLNIPIELVFDVKILFLLLFINFFLTTAGTALMSTAYIKNRLELTGIFKGISYIFEAAFLVIMYLFFLPNIWYVGGGLILSSLVVFITNIYMTKKFTPDLKIKAKFFSFDSVKKLIVSGVWNSVNSLGNILNTGLDLIVCNLLISPMAMGQLAIAKTISTMFSMLFQLLAQPFQPLFLKSFADNNKNQLIKELKLSMKMSGFFFKLSICWFFCIRNYIL